MIGLSRSPMKKRSSKHSGDFPWSFAYAFVSLAVVLALLLCVHELVLISGRDVGFVTLRFSAVPAPGISSSKADQVLDDATATLVIADEKVLWGAARDVLAPRRPASIRSLDRAEFERLLAEPEQLQARLGAPEGMRMQASFALAMSHDAFARLDLARLAALRRAVAPALRGGSRLPSPIFVSVPGL